MEPEVKAWGGPRKGAGRKPGPNARVTLGIPREVWAVLEKSAAEEGTTPEALAVRWLTERAHVPLSTR